MLIDSLLFLCVGYLHFKTGVLKGFERNRVLMYSICEIKMNNGIIYLSLFKRGIVMEEKLKDIYNEVFLREFGELVHQVYTELHSDNFIEAIMDEEWEELPLKARMRKIAFTLGKYLPESYEEALNILFQIDESCVGFPYLFFPDFVEVYGQEEEHWEISMKALERFTKGSSSEFAIRPFIIRDPERAMKQMLLWAKDSNEHVRRLSSEGCRPRLPWGIALQDFKKDPAPVIKVLQLLKNDESLYVRKSVANNLNDISKDNPKLVLGLAKKWIGKNSNTDWILRKGCRTLIKKADPQVMKLFGYEDISEGDERIDNAGIIVKPTKVKLGESCELNYEFYITEGAAIHLRIEYGIDFVKSKGKVSRKLFLLSDRTIEGGTNIKGSKVHSFADLTTRRHYEGNHRISLIINGQEKAHTEILLTK